MSNWRSLRNTKLECKLKKFVGRATVHINTPSFPLLFRILPSLPTKLLCFTRSSPLIRQLPSEFPSVGDPVSDSQQTCLQQYIHNNLEDIVLCKLTSRYSQMKLEEVVSKFSQSNHKVLLFIVDTATGAHQTKEQRKLKENINHLRMMIEEAELHGDVLDKLYVLLIHFPPAELFSDHPCYPAIFLQGWNHFYIDTIAEGTLTRAGTTASVVNIKQWLHSCLVKSKSTSHQFPRIKELSLNVEDILKDALPTVVSRITLRLDKQPLDVTTKTKVLNQLLLSSGSDSPRVGLGVVLAQCFSKYWSLSVMNRYLKKFSSLAFSRKSTLNLTASIETTFRSLFYDFLVYKLSCLEISSEIYMLLDNQTDVHIVNVFLNLLETLPMPELEQLSQLSHLPMDRPHDPQEFEPRFPFLSEIIKAMDVIIEESHDEVKRELNMELSPDTDGFEDTKSQLLNMQQALIECCSRVVITKVSKLVSEKCTNNNIITIK